MKNYDLFYKLTNDERKKLSFAIIVVVGILNAILSITHAMWRDETQAWLIARDTILLPDSLFAVTSYEGHPCLWFIVLMPFAKLGFPAWTLKVISFSLVMIALFVFLKYVELPIWVKLLTSISPIFIYSFVVPARSYSLGVFLIICLMALYKKRNEQPILYAVVLALLLQTLTIFGGFVFGCSIVWTIETIQYMFSKEKKYKSLKKRIIGLFIVLFSALFLLWEFRYTNSVIGTNSYSINEIIRKLIFEFFFNIKIIYDHNFVIIALVACFGMLYMIMKKMKHAFYAFIIILFGIGWQVYVYALVYTTSYTRALTWLPIALFCFYIPYSEMDNVMDNDKIMSLAIPSLMCIFLFFSLSFQVDSIYNELKTDYCYSQGRELAIAVNELPDDAIIFISSSEFDSPVTAQVDKKHTVWSPFTKGKASYINRDPMYVENLKYDEFIHTIEEMFPEAEEVYVIVNHCYSEDDGVKEYYACKIDGLCENVEDGYDNLSKVFTANISPMMDEKFYLLKVSLND